MVKRVLAKDEIGSSTLPRHSISFWFYTRMSMSPTAVSPRTNPKITYTVPLMFEIARFLIEKLAFIDSMLPGVHDRSSELHRFHTKTSDLYQFDCRTVTHCDSSSHYETVTDLIVSLKGVKNEELVLNAMERVAAAFPQIRKIDVTLDHL